MARAPQEIVISRARLRRLCEADFATFARMNANAHVMRYFPKPWTVEESRAAYEKVNAEFEQRGFGVYALEAEGELAGVVGLSVPSFSSWFTPCVEILWRLQPEFWGRGLATEGAMAVLKMAADILGMDEVFAFAVTQNLPSLRVMERIGMTPCDPPAFDHPNVDEPELREHLLYRIQLSAGGL